MKYVLIQKPGFKESCLENLETFKAQTSEELIDRYNRSVKTGIVGVYKFKITKNTFIQKKLANNLEIINESMVGH